MLLSLLRPSTAIKEMRTMKLFNVIRIKGDTMKLHSATVIAAFAIMSLTPIIKAAEASAIPDFSGGIPGATLEKREQNKASETFHLKTDLSSKEFFKSLHTTLGAGWSRRKLNEEEMILSASKARSKNATVSLYVFEHSKFPSINIRVMHFKHKKENTGASAEIRVIRPSEKTSDILYSKSVVFKEFRDPGRLTLANGKEYYFYYKGITYDNIKTWKEGRKLNLTYSNTKGSQLHDPISGASARVIIYGSHLIEEITEKRLLENGSTIGIAAVYREEYELWDTMITRLLRELKASRSSAAYKDIETMHNLWLKYKEMRFKVGVSEFGHRSGTKTIIESAVRAVTAIKHQALFLRSLARNDEYP